tara:strand:- start:55 stop:441 length:387 start_codon:yes stop_codon:yes gene_type:complete
MDKINKTTNRNFGIVFFVFFLIIAIYPILNNEDIRVWSLITSFIFLYLGLINSILLTPLNAIWFKLGLYLGRFVAPIVMGFVYFSIVFPTFIFLKIFKKNYLNIKYEKSKKTYWIDTSEKNSSMKDQF